MSLKQQANDVLELLRHGSYTVDGRTVSITASQREACDNSRLYTPTQLDALRSDEPARGTQPTVEVVDGTTQHVARELASGGPVVLLNFASARNPGGGFTNGAKAQEEDLCRCSGLYPSLLLHRDYYDINRAQSSLLYTDHAIYTPSVPFFRVRGGGPLLAQPFVASIITAPAPNSGPYLRKHPEGLKELKDAFERRWRNVLCIARDQGQRTLLLGAWGCGAFGGDAEIAADSAARALTDLGASFDRVVFAIPGKGKRSAHNLSTFQQRFGS